MTKKQYIVFLSDADVTKTRNGLERLFVLSR